MAVATRNPTSDVSSSGAIGGAAGGSRWTVVDDHPDSTGADVLTLGTTAGHIIFGFSAFDIPAGSTSISVAIKYYDFTAGGLATGVGGRLRVGGNNYDVATHNPTNSYVLRTDTWAQNPKTSTDWTVDDINGVGSNALEAFGVYGTDWDPPIQMASIILEVTYTGLTGRVHQVYGEIPGIDRTGQVFQVYGAIPDAPRSGLVYQVFGAFPSLDVAGRVFMVFGRIPSPASGSGGPDGGSEGAEEVLAFERLIKPIHSTAFERPRGKQSWGHTGKVQARAGFSAGMRWTETYQPKRLSDATFWAFVEYLNELQQNERLFEISLPDILGRPTLLGTATGTALVNGANQVGFSLAADGWSGTLKRGDLIRVDGLTYTMVITADVTATNALPISPAILSGGSPADNAEIFYGSNLTVRAKIDGLLMPEVDGEQVYSGLRVTYREAP